MSYLNQNLENKDIPDGQLLKPADNPAEVWKPVRIGGKYFVVSFV